MLTLHSSPLLAPQAAVLAYAGVLPGAAGPFAERVVYLQGVNSEDAKKFDLALMRAKQPKLNWVPELPTPVATQGTASA